MPYLEECCWNYTRYYCKGAGCLCQCHEETPMRITDRPSNDQECAREKCEHVFGQHYVANDGVTVGCSWSIDDQRDGYSSCQCDGFLISYTYPAKKVARS